MGVKIRSYIYSLMTDRANGLADSLFKSVLYIASFLYFLGLKIVLIRYQAGLASANSLQAKVISVGNITLGGTGKTPLVEFIARQLLLAGEDKIAILTRGYRIRMPYEKKGRYNRKPFLFEEVGEEAVMIHRDIPRLVVLAGADRVRNGEGTIYRDGTNILILDDGFQYWRLSRDIDVLLIDATNPFGNGKLIPRGILREPIAAIARANIVVLTKTDAAPVENIEEIKNRIRLINPGALIVTASHKPTRLNNAVSGEELKLDVLKNQDVVIVCGIADPSYFKKTLNDCGAAIKAEYIFQDHHPYSFAQIREIVGKCQTIGVKKIVTTDKDIVKIKPIIDDYRFLFEDFKINFLVLGIQIELLENKDKFIELILPHTDEK